MPQRVEENRESEIVESEGNRRSIFSAQEEGSINAIKPAINAGG